MHMQLKRPKKATPQYSSTILYLPTLNGRWSPQRPLLLVLVLQPRRSIPERLGIDPVLDLFEETHLDHVLDARAHDYHLNALEFGGTSGRLLGHFGGVAQERVLDPSLHRVKGIGL